MILLTIMGSNIITVLVVYPYILEGLYYKEL
jgi:hypothetical protein